MAPRLRKPRPFVRLEKAEQSDAVNVLSALGKVYTLGTRRKKGDHQGTMQTPGISDLVVFLRPPKLLQETPLDGLLKRAHDRLMVCRDMTDDALLDCEVIRELTNELKRNALRPLRRVRLVMIEMKRSKGGDYSEDQLEFRQWCQDAGIDYIGGAFDVVVAWLIREKYVRANQFSHEHLTLVPAEHRC